jgi:integrase
MTGSTMQRWWTKCLERAELKHRPMHEARHTAITEFLRRSGNLKLAQLFAGHADIGTTANIYAHLDTTDLETALRALEIRRMAVAIVPTGNPDLHNLWRRRESNPRPRSHRKERLQA